MTPERLEELRKINEAEKNAGIRRATISPDDLYEVFNNNKRMREVLEIARAILEGMPERQEQLALEGHRVGVSRQALEEILEAIERAAPVQQER